MRGFRLFERPLGVFSSHPPLTILGYLPDYEPGVAYEGRLQYINNIGKCHVEIVEANLPPGHSAYVDNFNNEIVLVWPAYSPPDEEKPGIINGDFQSQNLEGWVDLRGNSWSVKPYESGPSNPYPPAPGNYAAWMEGVGRGDHVLESIKYSVTPGQTLMARSLWDQGPSNKDNNNLWTAFQFYNSSGGLLGGEVRGDRIHDRTNKSRHWSTVNTTVPGGAADVTVRLIAQRRNGRNRHIIVDNVQTSGLSYRVGVDNGDDFYLTIRVRDSANRVAYWTGIIPYGSFFVTSKPYKILKTDSLRASVNLEVLSYKVGAVNSDTEDLSRLSMEAIGFVYRLNRVDVESVDIASSGMTPHAFIYKINRVDVSPLDEATSAIEPTDFLFKQHPTASAVDEATSAIEPIGFVYS